MSKFDNLPRDLRRAGLDVVVVKGWRTRGRPGSFNPVGVLWHHTGAHDGKGDAASDLEYARWMFLTGRSDLPAPLCQLAISAEGTVYVGAIGRANHAGVAKSAGSVAAGDGNALYVGVECMNSGSQGWSDSQYSAMVTTGVVLGRLLGTSARAQNGHKETSITGKWDPGELDMDKFRRDVAAGLKGKVIDVPERDTFRDLIQNARVDIARANADVKAALRKRPNAIATARLKALHVLLRSAYAITGTMLSKG